MKNFDIIYWSIAVLVILAIFLKSQKQLRGKLFMLFVITLVTALSLVSCATQKVPLIAPEHYIVDSVATYPYYEGFNWYYCRSLSGKHMLTIILPDSIEKGDPFIIRGSKKNK